MSNIDAAYVGVLGLTQAFSKMGFGHRGWLDARTARYRALGRSVLKRDYRENLYHFRTMRPRAAGAL